jgi:hypothetical protein
MVEQTDESRNALGGPMKDSKRSRVIAVIAAAARKTSQAKVYDYGAGRYLSITVTVGAGKVAGYDYGSNSHFAGSNDAAETLNFYDSESASHLQMSLKGKTFSGYDYQTMSHFAGKINGDAISLFDYQTGRSHTYRVEAPRPNRRSRRRDQ